MLLIRIFFLYLNKLTLNFHPKKLLSLSISQFCNPFLWASTAFQDRHQDDRSGEGFYYERYGDADSLKITRQIYVEIQVCIKIMELPRY